MATKKVEMHSQLVRFAKVAWFKRLNLVRISGDYGSPDELKSLTANQAQTCWWKDTNGAVQVETITPDLIKEEMDQRAIKWQWYKDQAKENNNLLVDLSVWEYMFLEKGKLIVPDWLGLTGNRRSSTFVQAMINRKKLKVEEGQKPLDIDDFLPVIPGDYADPWTRLIAQFRENDGKTTNLKRAGHVDLFFAAKAMVNLGADQNKIRQVFSSPGIGIRHYCMVKLNDWFPNLDIANRIKLPIDDPRHIPLGEVQQVMAQSFLGRVTPESTVAYNATRLKKGELAQPVLTEQEVAGYLAGLTTIGGASPNLKMMGKEGVTNIIQGNPNDVGKLYADAIHKNNGALAQEGVIISPVCNAALAAHREAEYPPLEAVVMGIRKLPKGKIRDEKIAAVLKLLA